MKTVFVGTSAFAAAILEALAGSDHRPSLILTRPDRPRGRGRHSGAPPVAETARELGIEVEQPTALEEAVDVVAAVDPQVICVCAYGAMIREPLLSRYELINVHPSLLPRWRGAAPVERAIMAGDAETGVSIMRVTEGLDSGPVCAVAREPIESHDTYGTLAPRLEQLGAELLLSALDGPREYAEQQGETTYAEKIGPEDRLLDPQRNPVELERKVRALDPHIGARTESGLRVHAACVAAGVQVSPGELAAEGGRLLLGCAGGALELIRVQPPGGRVMDAGSYLRGHAV